MLPGGYIICLRYEMIMSLNNCVNLCNPASSMKTKPPSLQLNEKCRKFRMDFKMAASWSNMKIFYNKIGIKFYKSHKIRYLVTGINAKGFLSTVCIKCSFFERSYCRELVIDTSFREHK